MPLAGITERARPDGGASTAAPKGDQARRFEDLEKEALRLRRSASDMTLVELILKGAAKASLQSPRVVLPA